MSDWNVYYDPQKFGLRVLAEVDVDTGWGFDKFVAWADDEGKMYWGADAGCSCPSPFEMTDSKDQLEGGGRVQLERAYTSWSVMDKYREGSPLQVSEFMSQVKTAFMRLSEVEA